VRGSRRARQAAIGSKFVAQLAVTLTISQFRL
jgi:hypothetical protein